MTIASASCSSTGRSQPQAADPGATVTTAAPKTGPTTAPTTTSSTLASPSVLCSRLTLPRAGEILGTPVVQHSFLKEASAVGCRYGGQLRAPNGQTSWEWIVVDYMDPHALVMGFNQYYEGMIGAAGKRTPVAAGPGRMASCAEYVPSLDYKLGILYASSPSAKATALTIVDASSCRQAIQAAQAIGAL
jgi:hypothetical protein